MEHINRSILNLLTWWQLIAVIIHLNGCSRNTDIINNRLVDLYLEGKDNVNVPQTVSKILNSQSLPGVSQDQQKNEPKIFFKENRKWCITDEGKNYAKLIIKNGLFT